MKKDSVKKLFRRVSSARPASNRTLRIETAPLAALLDEVAALPLRKYRYRLTVKQKDVLARLLEGETLLVDYLPAPAGSPFKSDRISALRLPSATKSFSGQTIFWLELRELVTIEPGGGRVALTATGREAALQDAKCVCTSDDTVRENCPIHRRTT